MTVISHPHTLTPMHGLYCPHNTFNLASNICKHKQVQSIYTYTDHITQTINYQLSVRALNYRWNKYGRPMRPLVGYKQCKSYHDALEGIL